MQELDLYVIVDPRAITLDHTHQNIAVMKYGVQIKV
jgi:hypothetical protein